MVDKDIKLRLLDYFDPDELCNFLGLTTEEIIDAFEDKIVDCVEELEDYVRYGR